MVLRRCIVPSCTNTSESTPEKKFVPVPKDVETRILWFQAVGKKYSRSLFCHCCEDHFDLPSDAENYIRQKYLGGPLKMKPDIIPHKRLTKSLCRTCLSLIDDDDDKKISLAVPDEAVSNVLQICLPEIDFSLTSDPVLCNCCYRKIESFYNMKKTALAHEMRIVSLMKEEMKSLRENDKLRDDYKFNLLQHHKDITTKITKLTSRKRKEHNYDTECSQIDERGKKKTREATVKNEIVDDLDRLGKHDILMQYLTAETDSKEQVMSVGITDNGEEVVMADGITNNGQVMMPEDITDSGQVEMTGCIADQSPVIQSELITLHEAENTGDVSTATFYSSEANIEESSVMHMETMEKEPKKVIYNNEVCQVVYLNEDGTGSYTTVNVIQLLERTEEDVGDSNCLFCDNYTGDDILNHSFSHCNVPVKCNLCDFACEDATEDVINQHIYVHSIVSNEIEEEVR